MYAISKTFTDEFVNEVLMLNEKEHSGCGEVDNEIIESYKRLIDPNITKEGEERIVDIGNRIYRWKYGYKVESIDKSFIQSIYLYGVLEEMFDEAREMAEMYLSD